MQGNTTLALPTATLTVGGIGVNGQGALQNASGVNSIIVGTLAMSVATVIDTAGGELVLNAVMTGSALTKIGVGVLELTGVNSNTDTAATTVNEGTLLLGKTGLTAPAIDGPLVIGDGFGELVGINSVQLVSSSSTSASFMLSFNGQTTGSLLANSTPAQVQTALQALSTIGAGNVMVEARRVTTRSFSPASSPARARRFRC